MRLFTIFFIIYCLSTDMTAQYNGTGSVTQGHASTVLTNLYDPGTRVAGVGTITSTDGLTWTVPAATNYADDAFGFAPDMYNPDDTQFTSASAALAAYSSDDIVEVDSDGDLYTAYIFADNYFELYINGAYIGKDAIPFTWFNSHIVQFRVSQPFTIAMMLVDWEENLGLGSEDAQGFAYIPGDGGMVAVVKDSDGNTVATTGSEWKAQTFYTSPIKDLSCPTENGTIRSTSDCDTGGSNDGTSYYGLHWALDDTWMMSSFDDSEWPDAVTYTNNTIGVDNKEGYTNFTDIFDDNSDDAEFIWSSNVILDNLVITRYTVGETTEIDNDGDGYGVDEDCDDDNPDVFPGATEIAYNGIDDDCDDATLDDDLDQDGFLLDEDCDDDNPDVFPGANEIAYNGIDDDCDDATLDDDLDQDGFLLDEDCDDNNAEINPDATEIPSNGIDEDCDGMDLISSIDKVLSNTKVKIFPNPVLEIIHIETEVNLDLVINLYDMTGKLLKTSNGINPLPVAGLPSGTYLLEIKELRTGQSITQEIIKQ